MMDEMRKRLAAFSGDVSVYYESLTDGRSFAYNADAPLVAASVIKIPIMLEAYRAQNAGELSMREEIPLTERDLFPSCGVLKYIFPYGVSHMSIAALVELMIIVSDNSATNLLIDRLGMAQINRTLKNVGCEKTVLRRKLFDVEASAKGLENTIGAREMGTLLCRMAGVPGTRPLVSESDDAKMIQTLKHQRLNGKIPFYLHGYDIAHKTGEDDGITHDVGLVYEKGAEKPLCMMCFCSEHVDVPAFERFMQDFSREMVLDAKKE